MEQARGGAIPKKPTDHFSKKVVLLKNGDFQRGHRGQVIMPTQSEMSIIRARAGQYKKDVEFHARMSEDMVKGKLEETFPYLKDKGCFCAAKVNLDNETSRFDFHGTPHLWDGKTIRKNIKGNSTLYILEDDQMDTSGISGSDPESTQEELSGLIPWLRDNPHIEVSINPKESRLEGGAPCRFTFNPTLHPEVTSGRATFENLGTVQLERLSNGSLLGTIPASPVPGLVTVTLESQHGIHLGQTYIKYYGMEEVLREIVFCPDQRRNFEELMDIYCGLGGTSKETQNSGILGFTEPVRLLSLLVYTAAKVGAQQFVEIIFNTSSGRVVFDSYRECPPLPEVIARDHGNEETAHYLEGITKRFFEEIRTGKECSQTIDWPELVKAAEAAQKKGADITVHEEIYQIEDVPKETGYLGDVDTSSSESSEPQSSDSEDDIPTTATKDVHEDHGNLMLYSGLTYESVVTIDFGTSFSGFAFAFNHKEGEIDIHMNKEWGTDQGYPTLKTPTCLLLNPDKSFNSFGYEAQDRFAELDEDQAQEYFYFEKFKMILHNNENLNRETILEASNGKHMKALQVFTYSIHYLHTRALETIRERTGDENFSCSDVQWVLTVPGIWKPEAKQFMREAAYQAGLASPLKPEQLIIALEPKAASVYCRESKIRDFFAERRSNDALVIDIGGGTLDVTVHEIEVDGVIKKTHKATGGPYGGQEVNKEFRFLLESIFTPTFIQDYAQQNPVDWLYLMNDFEVKKRGKRVWEGGTTRIRLPNSFLTDITVHEEIYQIEDVPKETGCLGDVDTSSSESSEPQSSDSEDDIPTTATKGDFEMEKDLIENHNETEAEKWKQPDQVPEVTIKAKEASLSQTPISFFKDGNFQEKQMIVQIKPLDWEENRPHLIKDRLIQLHRAVISLLLGLGKEPTQHHLITEYQRCGNLLMFTKERNTYCKIQTGTYEDRRSSGNSSTLMADNDDYKSLIKDVHEDHGDLMLYSGLTRVKHKSVVAIDFGTSFSAFAFVFNHKEGETGIHMNKEWGTDQGYSTLKTPTCLLLNPDKSFNSFGYEAQDRFAELDKNQAQEYFYFEKFKMILHNNENLNRETILKASNGKHMKALQVFAYSIHYLHTRALEVIRERTGDENFSSSDVQWVLTVPAIWKPEAKQFMREAAYQAGLASPSNPEQLIIALEPEAAFVYCRERKIRDFVAESGSNAFVINTLARPETQYVVVDTGGGTLDVTVHQIQENGAIKKIHKATGGPYGGQEVNKEFRFLLESIFTSTFIQDYAQQNPVDWLYLMNDFELKKRGKRVCEGRTTRIRLPKSFVSKFSNAKGWDINAMIKERYSLGDLKVQRNEYLCIEPKIMTQLFDPVLNGIVTHLSNLFAKEELSEIECVFLVGGFADSIFLKERVKHHFGTRYRIMVPQNASLAVVQGAVMFGQKPGIFESRLMTTSYGIRVHKLFIDGVHPESKKEVIGGIPRCKDSSSISLKWTKL